MSKLKNYRDLTEAKLKEELGKKRSELNKQKIALRSGKESNPKEMRILKVDIARILTIIREKELFEKANKKAQESSQDNK